MPHIHTESGQYDHTVTAYIVRTDGAEPRALLHMHRKLHKLLPVGGHIELDETPWQAIAHELREEAGYLLESLQILQPVSRIRDLSLVVVHPYPIVSNTHEITKEHAHSDTAYAFVATDAPESTPDEKESTDLRWLTFDELCALPEDTIWQNTKETYIFILQEALQYWELVPTSQYSLESVSKA